MEVNSQSLHEASLDEAYNILGNLQPGSVSFKIRRKKNNADASRSSLKRRGEKARSDAGDGTLAKWGNLMDLRTPSTPVPDNNMANLMTPARHLTSIFIINIFSINFLPSLVKPRLFEFGWEVLPIFVIKQTIIWLDESFKLFYYCAFTLIFHFE